MYLVRLGVEERSGVYDADLCCVQRHPDLLQKVNVLAQNLHDGVDTRVERASAGGKAISERF